MKIEPQYNENEVVRCRNVRDFFDRKFKTVEAYCAWLERRDRRRNSVTKAESKPVPKNTERRADSVKNKNRPRITK